MAGLNLMDMILSTQGGAAKQQMGQQLGLNEDQATMALRALLPALSAGLKANTEKPGGMQSLLQALQGGQHSQYLDQPETLSRPEAIQDGNAILGHLLGSKDVSRAVASKASEKTGIGEEVLKMALPMIATMVMGSLSKQTQDPGIAGQLMGMLGGTQPQPPQGSSQGGGLLGGLLGAVMGGSGRQQAAAQPQQSGMMGMLGNLLDADQDGSPMDDIFDMVMKQRR
ncbi:MAG: DUF937 domain-containing protein [Hyphomonadaceae bacterium]|nr:DUF937 domain-containing protein [Hyphomonadaceae bacterium]